MRSASRSGLAGGGLALLVLAVTGWGAVVLRDRPLVSWFTDDTFYYLEVARHVARGEGFTFDGLHRTNGFQPLWLFLLVPLARIVSGDFQLLRFLCLLQSVLLAGAIVLFWRTLKERLGPQAAAATSLLLIGMPGASALWIGMESALFLLLLVLAWRAWLSLDACESPGARDCWRLGTCCALLFLARLEGSMALLVALVLSAGRLWKSGRRATLFTALLLPPALVAMTYLAWNRTHFGLWLPISGMIKAHWFAALGPRQKILGMVDIPWIGRDLLARIYGTPMPPDGARLLCGVTFLAAACVAWRQRRRLAPLARDTGTTFLFLCCALIMVFDQMLVGPFLADWATVPVRVLTAVIFGWILLRVSAVRRAALVAVLVLSLLRIPVQAGLASHWKDSFMGQSLLFAEWISGSVPPDERLGSLFAGVLSYFGHRTVVNLDGLVNDREFYRQVLIAGEWDRYLEDTNVRWLMDVGCRGDPPLATLLTAARGKFTTAGCYSLTRAGGGDLGGRSCGLQLWHRTSGECARPTPGPAR